MKTFLTLALFISLANKYSATDSDLPARRPSGSTSARLIDRLTAQRDALLARRDALPARRDALLAPQQQQPAVPPAVTVLGLDGISYPVPLRPDATVGDLWLGLAAQHGTISRTNYTLHGTRADAEDAGAPLACAAAVADYDNLVIVARQELIESFHLDGPNGAVVSGDRNETAADEGDGYVLLGPWVPRGTPLRARLRLDRVGGGALVGLVREEAWASVVGAGNSSPVFTRAGWTYETCGGDLFDNSSTSSVNGASPAWCLTSIPFEGGVVEVEARWDAESGAGELLYTIQHDTGYTIYDAPQVSAFQIPGPNHGGNVALAVFLNNGAQMTLVAE